MKSIFRVSIYRKYGQMGRYVFNKSLPFFFYSLSPHFLNILLKYLFIHLSTHLPVHLNVHLPTYQSINPSINKAPISYSPSPLKKVAGSMISQGYYHFGQFSYEAVLDLMYLAPQQYPRALYNCMYYLYKKITPPCCIFLVLQLMLKDLDLVLEIQIGHLQLTHLQTAISQSSFLSFDTLILNLL